MALGLAALLDDIAAIAKSAAASIDDIAGAAGKAATKAIGVVVDDTAVTPQYVQGLKPTRELPIIWRIAKGSLLNKLIIIIAILGINQWIPWLLVPLLMLGGAYLCFEGAEKVIEWLHGLHTRKNETALVPAINKDATAAAADSHLQHKEDRLVKGAVSTDFILSAEIMVIALNEIKDQSFGALIGALILTAVLITTLVYGTVALLVKMDDLGLGMMQSSADIQDFRFRFGQALVKAMPKVMLTISIIGTLAMMWVGGHLVVQGFADLGFHPILDLIHYLAALPPAAFRFGGFTNWLIETIGSMIFGFLWGSLIAIPILLIHAFHNKNQAGNHELSA